MKYLALCRGLCTALPECRCSVGWSVCVTNVERGMYSGHTVPDVIHWSVPTYLRTIRTWLRYMCCYSSGPVWLPCGPWVGESCSLPLSREDAERALNELKRIGGRQVSVSMATKRKRKRRRGKTAITNNDHDESNLLVDEVDEEHGSIAEEDVDGGSSLGEHCCIVLLAPTSDHCSLYTFIDAHTYVYT